MRWLFVLISVGCLGFALAGCGQHHDLASIAPPSDAWFQEQVAGQDLPVLVDFGADWCGYCVEMEPRLNKLETEFAGKLKVVRVNVDERSNLAAHYGVDGLPTFLIFKNGRVVANEGGSLSYMDLKEWVTKYVP